MIQQLFETHLPVTNLDRSMRFYEDVLRLELGTFEENRRIAFYWVGGPQKTMLGLWEEPDDRIQARHIAFQIGLEDMDGAIESLRKAGVPRLDFYENESDMPSVFGWMPAAAIYFRDPDGHLLEYIAILPGAPRPELGVVTLSEWFGR